MGRSHQLCWVLPWIEGHYRVLGLDESAVGVFRAGPVEGAELELGWISTC
jgi:hypothetical protein